MTLKKTTTCNKCGATIGEHASHWTATFAERRDPNAAVPAIYLYPQPNRVDICTECVHEVLGPLIDHARTEESLGEADDGVYRVRIPESSRAWAQAEARQIAARGDTNDSLRATVAERLAEAARLAETALDFPDLRHAATFQRPTSVPSIDSARDTS